MSFLVDVLEEYEILFTVSSTETRAWQNQGGKLVQVDVQKAMLAKQQDAYRTHLQPLHRPTPPYESPGSPDNT